MKNSARSTTAVAIALLVLLTLVAPARAVATPSAFRQADSPADTYIDKAIAALGRSEFIDAENELRRAIAADPNHALAYSWMGQVFSQQLGRDKEAVENAQKAADMAPEDGRVLALLADIKLQTEDPQALSLGEKAARLAPKDALVQSVLARAYIGDARWDKAREAALTAIRLDAKQPRAYQALGRFYLQTGDYVRAVAAFQESLKLEPKSALWRTLLALAYAESGDPERALREADAALKAIPDYPPALIESARLQLSRGMVPSAEARLARLVKAAPNAWQTRLLRAHFASTYGEYSVAEGLFQRALAVSPDNLAVYLGMGWAKLEAGECADARDIFEKQLKTHPRVSDIYTGLSYSYGCAEDYRQALDAAEQAVELDPYRRLALEALALAQMVNDRPEDARETYRRAAALAPAPAVYIASVAQTLFDNQEPAAAEAEFRVVTELMPDDADSQFLLCAARGAQEKFVEALPACERAHFGDSQNAAVARLYGLMLVANNQANKGIQMLQLALKDEPESALGHRWLATGYMKARRFKDALAEYRAYLETGESDQVTKQIVSLLEAGYTIKDRDMIAESSAATPSLFKSGAFKAQVTGKTATDRVLAVELKGRASATNETLLPDTFLAMGLAAHYGARLDPPVTAASVRVLDGKGNLFIGMTAPLDALQNIAYGVYSGEAMLQSFEIESGAAAKGGVTSEDIAQIGKDVVDLRGLKERKPISVTLISQDEFAQGYEEAMTEEMIGQQERNEAMFRLLGALGPKESLKELTGDLLNEQVLGYYDSQTDELRVLKDKTPDAMQRLTVAHEYAHALQDQNLAMLGEDQANSDAELAIRALVEGDASLTTAEFADKKMDARDILVFMGKAQSELDEDKLDAAPDFLSELVTFPYTEGEAFARAAFERGGWKAVNDLYAKPPLSTEQVLHPERYRAGEKPVEVTLPKLASALGGDWAIAEEDVIGEIGWRALLQGYTGRTFAAQAAQGWGGDRYALLKDKSGAYALAIDTVWDTSADAEDFAGMLRTVLKNREAFKEVTDDLLSAEPLRVWQGADAVWIVKRGEKGISIAVGETRDLAEKIIAAFNK